VRILISLSLLVSFSTASWAQDPPLIDTELENLAGSYAECAAYYRLVFFALEATGEPETAAAYREFEDNALLISLVLASSGREQDMAVNVTNSRVEMNMQLMKQEVDNRNENISILINKYQLKCKELSENPSELVVKVVSDAAQQR
jgi:hypothetical protein